MTRTEIAALYYYSNLRCFNRRIIESGLHLVMPQILKRKAHFFPADMAIIQAYLGVCPRWEEYLSKKKVISSMIPNTTSSLRMIAN